MPAVKERKLYDDVYREIPDLLKEGSVPYVQEDIFMTREEVNRRQEEFEKTHVSVFKEHESTIHKTAVRKSSFKSNFRKLFEVTVSCLLIVMIGVFVGILLYPQTELAEISRDNSDLKDEISELRKKILDTEENINGVNDMDSLRAQALALGMQDPNANQVIIVPMASDDKLVTMITYDTYGVSEEAYNNAVGNLARYYIEEMVNGG
ncbi:MAG: hypothetical protein J5685_06835 [Clostridiales bacterium]|nr:hypothetical protein [Clostridiales bacterium]